MSFFQTKFRNLQIVPLRAQLKTSWINCLFVFLHSIQRWPAACSFFLSARSNWEHQRAIISRWGSPVDTTSTEPCISSVTEGRAAGSSWKHDGHRLYRGYTDAAVRGDKTLHMFLYILMLKTSHNLLFPSRNTRYIKGQFTYIKTVNHNTTHLKISWPIGVFTLIYTHLTIFLKGKTK